MLGEDEEGEAFLSEINPFELSPTSLPANRWMSVFQKTATKHQETIEMSFPKATEWLSKSDLSEKAKKAAKAAMDALEGAKAEFTDEQMKAFRKALEIEVSPADDDEREEAEEKARKAEDEAEKAKSALATARAEVKKSVAFLDASEPDARAALDILASIVGHKPIHQVLAELPAAAKAQIEELQKSAAADRKKLQEIEKAQAEAAQRDALRVMTAKAAALSNVPLGTAELGELLQTVHAASPKAGEQMLKLLGTVNEVVAKSALFTEKGSRAVPVAAGSAEAEIDKLAAALVQKSEGEGKRMSQSAAWAAICDLHPELAQRYDAEKTARTRPS